VHDAGKAQRLRGKVALVTGAGGANSIGNSIALRLAAEGAVVGALDVSAERAALVVEAIAGAGGRAVPLICDLTQLGECERAAASLAAAHCGRIDILVNNAAAFTAPGSAQTSATFLDWTAEEWDHILDVNLRGMWFMLRAVFPYMQAQGYGKVVNVTSSTFWEAPPGLLPYISSKGGVIGFTRAIARELGPFGIRVNALAPGLTLTQSNLDQGGDILERADAIRRSQCLNERNEVADDLAGPAFFLVSSDSDFMTGQTLLVNGGLSFS
jgi:NAD(P)-dependent dehydrogenase (short-subunit alcohol dehydrogenase family)